LPIVISLCPCYLQNLSLSTFMVRDGGRGWTRREIEKEPGDDRVLTSYYAK
jgi:hypothetical protein